MMEVEIRPPDQDEYVDLPSDIPLVHHTKVKVECKKSSCNVDGLNMFFQEWIATHFKFNVHTG